MIQRFTSLPLALKVLISAVVLGVLLILAMGTPAMIAKTFERFSGFIGREIPQQAGAPGNEYLSMVEEIQTGSVDSFLQSDEKFSRFDSLTPGDVEVMKTDYNTLGEYLNRADNLDPPERYKDQHELFRSAIADLYQAAGLAYSTASDPSSLTKSGLDEYDLLVDRASLRLQQSNEILGRDYKTIPSRKSG